MTIMYLPWEAQSETRAQAEADRKPYPCKSIFRAKQTGNCLWGVDFEITPIAILRGATRSSARNGTGGRRLGKTWDSCRRSVSR